METLVNRLHTLPYNRQRRLGLGHAAWCADAPRPACLATASGWWAGDWAWPPPAVVLGPGVCTKVGFSNSFDCALLKIRLQHCALFLYLCIFTCFWVCVLQNMFLRKQVEQGQSICIRVKVCLLLLFLDYNWWF
jgi:hypothetical protein